MKNAVRKHVDKAGITTYSWNENCDSCKDKMRDKDYFTSNIPPNHEEEDICPDCHATWAFEAAGAPALAYKGEYY